MYAPAPTADKVAAAFDAGDGFSRASAITTRDASWRLQPPATFDSTNTEGQPLHWLLNLVSVLALVSTIVLATPTRRAAR